LASISTEDLERFLVAGLFALRRMDALLPMPMRFGKDADARWGDFAGQLTLGDRIALLLRDAAVNWGSAFSLAAAINQDILAHDGLLPVDAKEFLKFRGELVWRRAFELSSPTGSDSWKTLCQVWGIPLSLPAVPHLSPGTKIFVGGVGALSALLDVFGERPDLNWEAQVHFVVDGDIKPLWKQQGAMAAIWRGSVRPTQVVGVESCRKELASNPTCCCLFSLDAPAHFRALNTKNA
jgi:hypothetical protein